jgi:nicotinamide riboside transporter PnuC
MLSVIEWTGTLLILTGLFFLSSRKASNPKTRIKGLITTIIGCVLLGIIGFLMNLYGVMITQIGVSIINMYGIYNCRKEIHKCNTCRHANDFQTYCRECEINHYWKKKKENDRK